MKKLHSVKMLAMLTVLAAGSVQARNSDCEGPLDCGRWYVMPKIGVAPGIFANRGYEHYVVPAAVLTNDCQTTQGNVNCRTLIADNDALFNVFQQNSCKGLKFGQLFSNGVLHVGFELGHNTSDNGQCFLEFFYDRANGRDVCYKLNQYRALAGCTNDDCNTNCTTFTGDALQTAERTDCLDKYTAYGVYFGHRHYFNRIFCDRFAFFTGVKFGLQHRKAVNANSTYPATTAVFTSGTGPTETYAFAERSLCNIYYCKSNAVSGSVQFGFDYCINDCLTAVVGVEVQATAPFRTNQNIVIPAQNGTVNGVEQANSARLFAQVTNFIPASTGTFVQFPVWVGFRWEFDFCKTC